MYALEYSTEFEKGISKLPKEVQERVIKVLECIRIRPYHFVTRLVGSPLYRLRAGDYRIILDIKDDKLIILVIEIGHRKSIYK